MPQAWTEIRVFISSTFRDMHAGSSPRWTRPDTIT